MNTWPRKRSRLLLGCVLALSLANAWAPGQTPPPSATPLAPALSTPPELHPAVRAVGIHSAKGEQRHTPAVYVQRGDEI